ncbi:MAG: 4Fe-4S dicluster domain-containing protein [Spirochaetales bacterium]|nr:4Fe-4S dicluster domain-containing protein [Spirochaetales bacterium]
MDNVTISKKDFLDFVEKKIQEGDSKVIGVVGKGSSYVFDRLESSSRLCLDYDVTILPPKKYFQPPREVLLRFITKKADSYITENANEPLTIIGIHYYDLAAISLMDRAFSEGNRDENYLKKRENSLLIGMYPTQAFKYRFAGSVVKGVQPYKAADLMLADMGDGNYTVEIVTEKGRAYLSSAVQKPFTYSLEELENAKKRIKDDQKIPVPIEMSPDFLVKNHGHPVWEVFGEKCYSCGSCVLVCPTCYCFDVLDEVDLDLKNGKRIRVWDGCMLENFATCAGGHNFRKTKAARFRHRIFRKGVNLPLKYNYYGCVGCGRCAHACTSSIAGPVKVLTYIQDNQ